MTDMQRLLAEYVAEHQAGAEADPLAYLDRLSDPSRRDVLAEEIDRYLMSAPRRVFDPAAFATSVSAQIVDALERALMGRSGLWPALLPQFRARAGVKRTVLVQRLADALGVADRQGKVGAYYHQMEQGLLPAAGVSDRVLTALARSWGRRWSHYARQVRRLSRPGAGPRVHKRCSRGQPSGRQRPRT